MSVRMEMRRISGSDLTRRLFVVYRGVWPLGTCRSFCMTHRVVPAENDLATDVRCANGEDSYPSFCFYLVTCGSLG